MLKRDFAKKENYAEYFDGKRQKYGFKSIAYVLKVAEFAEIGYCVASESS
jgi:hypothetical protein